MKEFEILEHTADIGIAAYGKTKSEVFINTARGMFKDFKFFHRCLLPF